MGWRQNGIGESGRCFAKFSLPPQPPARSAPEMAGLAVPGAKKGELDIFTTLWLLRRNTKIHPMAASLELAPW
jgi:hypothetical protein